MNCIWHSTYNNNQSIKGSFSFPFFICKITRKICLFTKQCGIWKVPVVQIDAVYYYDNTVCYGVYYTEHSNQNRVVWSMKYTTQYTEYGSLEEVMYSSTVYGEDTTPITSIPYL